MHRSGLWCWEHGSDWAIPFHCGGWVHAKVLATLFHCVWLGQETLLGLAILFHCGSLEPVTQFHYELLELEKLWHWSKEQRKEPAMMSRLPGLPKQLLKAVLKTPRGKFEILTNALLWTVAIEKGREDDRNRSNNRVMSRSYDVVMLVLFIISQLFLFACVVRNPQP